METLRPQTKNYDNGIQQVQKHLCTALVPKTLTSHKWVLNTIQGHMLTTSSVDTNKVYIGGKVKYNQSYKDFLITA